METILLWAMQDYMHALAVGMFGMSVGMLILCYLLGGIDNPDNL